MKKGRCFKIPSLEAEMLILFALCLDRCENLEEMQTLYEDIKNNQLKKIYYSVVDKRNNKKRG